MLATVTTDILATPAAGPRQAGRTAGQGLFARILAHVGTAPAEAASADALPSVGLPQDPARRRAVLEDLGLALDGLVEWAVSLKPVPAPVANGDTPSRAGGHFFWADFATSAMSSITGVADYNPSMTHVGQRHAPDLNSSTILSGWQGPANGQRAEQGTAVAGLAASPAAPQFFASDPNTSAPPPNTSVLPGNPVLPTGPAMMSGATGQPMPPPEDGADSAILPAPQPTVASEDTDGANRSSILGRLGDRLGAILQRFDADHGTDTVGVLAHHFKSLQALDLPPGNPVAAAARLVALARGVLGVPDQQVAGPGAMPPGNDTRFAGPLFGAVRLAAQEPPLSMPAATAPVADKQPDGAVLAARSATAATGGLSLADLAPQIRPLDLAAGIRHLQLAPAELGAATFEIVEVAPGMVSILIRAGNPRVLAVLRENAAAIAGLLRDGATPTPNSPAGGMNIEVSVAQRPGLAGVATPPADGRPPAVPNVPPRGAQKGPVAAGGTGPFGQTPSQLRTDTPDMQPAPGGDGRRMDRLMQVPHAQPAAPASKPEGPVPGQAPKSALGESPIDPMPTTTQSPVQAVPEVRVPPATPDLLPIRGPETAYPAQSHAQHAALAANLSEQIRSNRILAGTTRIELTPKGLGTLEIDLAQDEAGGLKITVRAENLAVLGALRENREVLLSALRDGGVSVQNGSLGFEEFGRGARQQHKPEAGEYRPAAKAEPDPAPAVAPLTETALPKGRVDIIT